MLICLLIFAAILTVDLFGVQMLLLSQDYGKHLLGVEDLLQKHALVEADIAIQADRVKAVSTNATKFSVNDSGEQHHLSEEPCVI